MTHTELQEIQDRIKFDCKAMAACLGIDYPSYRHLYYGHTKIPESVAVSAKAIEYIELERMAKRYQPGGEFDQIIRKMHPFGIMSEVEKCE